jgi:hypothetical protein
MLKPSLPETLLETTAAGPSAGQTTLQGTLARLKAKALFHVLVVGGLCLGIAIAADRHRRRRLLAPSWCIRLAIGHAPGRRDAAASCCSRSWSRTCCSTRWPTCAC